MCGLQWEMRWSSLIQDRYRYMLQWLPISRAHLQPKNINPTPSRMVGSISFKCQHFLKLSDGSWSRLYVIISRFLLLNCCQCGWMIRRQQEGGWICCQEAGRWKLCATSTAREHSHTIWDSWYRNWNKPRKTTGYVQALHAGWCIYFSSLWWNRTWPLYSSKVTNSCLPEKIQCNLKLGVCYFCIGFFVCGH